MTTLIYGGDSPLDPIYPAQRSVRLRSGASAYFNRTFSASPTTFTFSCWVKRGTLGVQQVIAASRLNGAQSAYILFNATDQIVVGLTNGSGFSTIGTSTAVYRDPAAWYHIVFSSTAGGNGILYVNGAQVFSGSVPAGYWFFTNTASWVNAIGRLGDFNGQYLDGYLTEINFIDGQALSPTAFGSINPYTGVWQFMDYTGTYGTNGFYLNFQDNSGSTATTIGKDSSGNGNNWTPNNISLAAGTTYDSMLDVPTRTSPNAANFCTLNNIFPTVTGTTWSNGNLTLAFTAGSAAYYYPGTMLVNQGEWYFEGNLAAFANGNAGNNFFMMGFKTPETTVTGRTSVEFGWGSNGTSMALRAMYIVAGTTITNTVFNTVTPISTDIFGIAYNAYAGSADFYKNGVLMGSITGMSLGEVTPVIYRAGTNNAATWNLNFGQRPFAYPLPAGYAPLNTYNISNSMVPNGAAQFAATLYTGTGATISIVNTIGNASFSPGLVWIKSRSAGTNHVEYDVVRGPTKQLVVNSNTAETTEVTGLTAFNSSGFTLGTLAALNTNAATYVAWNWKGGNSTVNNTAGSVSAQVNANVTAGFSTVTFPFQTVGIYTIGHGLNVPPDVIIVKSVTSGTQAWVMYHTSLGNTSYVVLNSSAIPVSSVTAWNNTSPTSSVFTLGSGFTTANYGTSGVAYCFASIPGYSKFGRYISNGLADGPFVITGFRPRYILIKETSAIRGWIVFDTSRSPFNIVDKYLFVETGAAEGTLALIDIVSNGFRLKSTNINVNDASGNTFIYMAFAENPFQNALAR